MKKTLILMLCLITLTLGVSFADNQVKVTYANYPIRINGQAVDNRLLPYPFLVYNQITYVPLTWDFTQALSLSTHFDTSQGLAVSLSPQNSGIDKAFTYEESPRSLTGTSTAQLASFPVTINGERIISTASSYPVLVYKGITYLPLTYDFIVNKCQIQYTYDGQSGLALQTGTRSPLIGGDREGVTASDNVYDSDLTPSDSKATSPHTGYIALSANDSPLQTYFQTYETLGVSSSGFIRDQGEDNTCWAYASNTLFEISLLKRFGKTYNLDEDLLIADSPIPADKTSGGYYDMAAGYYLQNNAPIDQLSGQVIPYRLMGYYSITGDIDAIKRGIMTYGGGITSIYLDQQYAPADEDVYRTMQLDKSMINHDVILIGWDDSKNAFIAQNSWGNAWGNDGLFYIAYDDQFANQKVTFMTDIMPRDDYEIMTYTPTGITHYNNLNEDHSITGLNVFPLDDSQTIDEVGFYVGSDNTSVIISLAKDPQQLEDLTTLGYMIVPYAGYYTYELSNPLNVENTDSVGIAVNYNNAEETFLLPVEAPYPQIEYSVTGDSNQSYILIGSMFKDLVNYRSNANIGINLYYSQITD